MELTILGTACMVPTRERNVSAQFLTYQDEGILVDCGEGTQRQMNIAGLNRNRVSKVLITHWHGDHTAGLIGLIQTIGHGSQDARLMIFGPMGTKSHVEHLLKSVVFDVKIDLDVREFDPDGVETIFDSESYKIEAASLEHSTPCLGYSFVEKDSWTVDAQKAEAAGLKSGPQVSELKRTGHYSVRGKVVRIEDVARRKPGRKISFIFDTEVCQACYALAKGADVLVCESTHSVENEEKAAKYRHLTTKDAAMIANTAGVKKLIATHFSQRYKTLEKLEEELTGFFPNTIIAHDLLKLKI